MVAMAGAACIALVGAISCNDPALKTDCYEMNEVAALSEARADSISLSVSVEYPVSGLQKQACSRICESIAGMCFGLEAGSVEEAAGLWADSCVDEYRKQGTELLEYLEGNDDDGPCAVLAWEKSVSGHIAGVHGDYLSYIIGRYQFSGGAHGSTEETAVVFNRKTGSVTGEDEFFAEGSKEELGKLLSAHLRESMPDDDAYNALFVKEIEPNGNFFVTPEGVSYIFGQYEIGPYYLGIIKIALPWAELEGLCR